MQWACQYGYPDPTLFSALLCVATGVLRHTHRPSLIVPEHHLGSWLQYVLALQPSNRSKILGTPGY